MSEPAVPPRVPSAASETVDRSEASGWTAQGEGLLAKFIVPGLVGVLIAVMGSAWVSINGRIDDTNATMNARFAEANTNVNERFAEVNGRITGLETRVGKLSEDMAVVLNILQTRLPPPTEPAEPTR